jgi:hypothetical protein
VQSVVDKRALGCGLRAFARSGRYKIVTDTWTDSKARTVVMKRAGD